MDLHTICNPYIYIYIYTPSHTTSYIACYYLYTFNYRRKNEMEKKTEHLFKPGNKLGGRKAGSLNRSTEEMKLTITRAVNNTLSTISKDLEDIKKRNPERAMELALKLLEYTMPKLKSIDVKGTMEVNAKIQQISIHILDGTKHKDE